MVEVGQILEGRVTGLTGFGAFVSLPGNLMGLVHISEVSDAFVSDIREVLSENQVVRVKVLGVTAGGKISLSIRRAAQSGQGGRPPRQNRRAPNVWKGQASQKRGGPQSFEDMMARFKKVSDEKMTELKKAADGRRSSYSKKK